MQNVDPATEWRRLQELYGQMTDEELEVVAEEAYDLTDVAREVLQSEIRNRRLNVELKATPMEAEPEPEPDINPDDQEFDPAKMDLVQVRRVWDLNELKTAKQILDYSGIPSYIGPENLEDPELYKGSFEKGVVLRTWEGDQQRAYRAFYEHWPNGDSAPEQAEIVDAAVVCPKCNSRDVIFESRDREPLGDDEIDAKFNWTCAACGNIWADDGVEREF